MPIITGRENVLAVYEEAAKRGWVIPCLCSESYYDRSHPYRGF